MARVSVTVIDGANIEENSLDGFTPADILHHRGESFEEYRRDLDVPTDVVVGISITQVGHGQTVVTLFNHDGEAIHYIGPSDYFAQVPALDEEPAYDNYHGV